MATNPELKDLAELARAPLIVLGRGDVTNDRKLVTIKVESALIGTLGAQDLEVDAGGYAGEVTGERQVFALARANDHYRIAVPPAHRYLTPRRVQRFRAGGNLGNAQTDTAKAAAIAIQASAVFRGLVEPTDLGASGTVVEVLSNMGNRVVRQGDQLTVPDDADWDLGNQPVTRYWLVGRTDDEHKWILLAPALAITRAEAAALGWP